MAYPRVMVADEGIFSESSLRRHLHFQYGEDSSWWCTLEPAREAMVGLRECFYSRIKNKLKENSLLFFPIEHILMDDNQDKYRLPSSQ